MANPNPACAVRLTGNLSQSLDGYPDDSEHLRARAARYRQLMETLTDPRVIAVVKACALELETKAILNETSDEASAVIELNSIMCR